MEPIIRAKNLNFVYNKGKDNEFHALVNINMEIYPEEFVMFFGPSGCGKSTLLNVVAGLEIPDEGSEVMILNRDMMKLTKKQFAEYHRHDLGMVFQAYNLITSLSVLDNVALPQMFLNISKHKREKWGMQLLERFGIAKQYKKIPTELSGGQQQRIGIARAIVNNPLIVLADEPVGNLDSVSAKNVLEILTELNEKEKKTIIMVTHNPENLVYADRIFYLKDGTIIREVVNKDKHKEILKQEQKSPAAEIEDLMRAYHGLTPEQINILIMPYKSRIFAHHFVSTRTMEETKTFEDIIQRRLMGTISSKELYETLHRSAMEGGVGFDVRKADKIIKRIVEALKMAYFVYQTHHQQKDEKGEHPEVTKEEKGERLTTYLLHACYDEHAKNLHKEQIDKIKETVVNRIENKIQKNDFYKALDLPLKDGGAGLNSKTAQAITEEMELILILGFGVVKVNPQDLGEDVETVDTAKEKDKKEEISIAELAKNPPVEKDKLEDVKEKIAAPNFVVSNIAVIDEPMKNEEQKGGADASSSNEIKSADVAEGNPEDKLDEEMSLQDAIAQAQERENKLKNNSDNNQENKD